MSLSKPQLKSPVTRFIEFHGAEGVFQYWDKEKKQKVKMPMPIRFVVLDELNTIKGFSDSTSSGIYSNEVHNLKTQILNVRTFKGRVSVTGNYADIKDKITAMGGKFCKSIYAAMIVGDGLELCNFQLTGAAFKSWVDKLCDVNSSAVVFNSTTDAKKGAVNYKIPNFTAEPVSPELLQKAIVMDEQLQEFLKKKKLNEIQSKVEEESVQEHPEDECREDSEEMEDRPF